MSGVTSVFKSFALKVCEFKFLSAPGEFFPRNLDAGKPDVGPPEPP